MKIYLIRHGFYEIPDINIIPPIDVNLTSEAKVQINEVSNSLKRKGIEKIISSPITRTYQTANIISETISVPVEKNELFSERKRPSEIIGRSAHDKEVKNILDLISNNYSNLDFRYSDEENFLDLKERGKEALKCVIERKEEIIAIVTHAEFGTMLVSLMLLGPDLPSELYLKARKFFFMGLNTPSLLEYKNNSWRLMQWNTMLDELMIK